MNLVGILLVIVGSVLLWAAIKDKNPLDEVKRVLQGDLPIPTIRQPTRSRTA